LPIETPAGELGQVCADGIRLRRASALPSDGASHAAWKRDRMPPQTLSDSGPMEAHPVRALAVEAWRRAEAMRLVEPDARRLDAADVARLLRRLRDAGIARAPALRLDNVDVPCVEEAEALLRVVIAALDASPIAKLEWVVTLRRALWAVEIGDEPLKAVSLPKAVLIGAVETYEACQNHARRLRARGARRIVAPSATLVTGGAAARTVVAGGERAVAPRDGRVIVVFGAAGGLVGWKAVERGAPPVDVLPRVQQVQPTV
jgi:hypothetical protein